MRKFAAGILAGALLCGNLRVALMGVVLVVAAFGWNEIDKRLPG